MTRRNALRDTWAPPSVYTVFANIPTYIYLIMIPVVQNYLFDPSGFFERIASYAVSLLLTAGAAAVSAAGYFGQHISADETGVSVRRGLFIRRTYRASYARLQSAAFAVSPVMRLFSAVRVSFSACRFGNGMSAFYLTDETAGELRGGMLSGLGKKISSFRARNGRTLLAAALLSNPFGGFAAAAPFIRGVGRAAGENARSELVSSLDFSQLLVLIGIPPAAAFLTYLFIAFSLVSALRAFFASYSLRADIYERGAVVRRGLVTRRETIVPFGCDVRVTVLRTLPMLPLRLRGCALSPRELGRRGSVTVAPAADRDTARSVCRAVFGGDLPRFTVVSRPKPRELPRYVAAPGLLMVLCAAALPFAVRAGIFAETVVLALAALVAFACIWLVFALFAFRFVSVSRAPGFVRVRTVRRLTLVEEMFRDI